MVFEGFRPTERGIKQEELDITPQGLLGYNRSPQAEANRIKWEEARRNGELIAYLRCSDARLKPVGINAVSWGSIAAADEPDTKFAVGRGTKASIALAHFDGDTVKPGEMPTGCGGLKAKEEAKKNGNQNEQVGIHRYVKDNIVHEDMIIQAWLSAENIAAISGKPSLAAVQDHLTLQIYPIALFTPQGEGTMRTVSRVRAKDTLARSYDPKKIYENGIPTISESYLTDVFGEIMQQNMEDMREINSKYPNLREIQKVQRPRTILFSTDIRSARVKYPVLSSVPGSIFKLIVPRGKIEGTLQITDEDLENSLNQLEYPITHAIKNYENPDESFSNTDRLIIETGNLDLSKRVAQKAMEKEWMRKWLELKDRKIIVVQAIAGIVSDNIAYYDNQPRIAGI